VIARQYVITSATCLKNNFPNQALTLQLGTDDRPEVVKSSNILVHPDSFYDVALVKLASNVAAGNRISPLCPWTDNEAIPFRLHSVGFDRNSGEE
jgi:hypothetical protein